MSTAVTKDTHPLLHEALEDVSHDCGRQAGHKVYRLPEPYGSWVDQAETGLATLTRDERVDLAIGEVNDQDAIRRRSPDLDIAHQLLDAFFEEDGGDWTATG